MPWASLCGAIQRTKQEEIPQYEAHAEQHMGGGHPSLPSSSFPDPRPQSELHSLTLANALVRVALWEPQALV